MSSIQLSLPDGYTYLYEDGVGEGRLKVRIAEVRDEISARAWLKDLEAISNVTWRVSKTYPHCGRVNLFQLDLRCQHKTDSRAQHTKRPHKHTGCPASLHIVVKRIVRYSRSQTASTNSTYPTIVVMDERHNHSISDADILKFRDMGMDAKQTLLDLFHRGHTASSALYCLKTDLLLEHGDEYFRVAADGHFLPSVSRVEKLYHKFRKESGGGDDILSDVNRLIDDYCDKDNGGTAKFGLVNDQCFVVICSALMDRTHRKLVQSSEVVTVDVAGTVHKQTPRVFLFSCSTAAGCIPLGVMVSSSERQDVFEAAVACLKTCFPEGGFYGNGCPKVFLTTSNLKEQRVLENQFPGSVVLLCEFHVLKTVWLWLVDGNNDISDDNDRQILYLQFKTMVYAADVETIESLHSSIVMSPVYGKYPKLWPYLASMWDLRNDWAHCYRQNLPTRRGTTSSYMDIVFRMVNDNIFNRARLFNLQQLVDFILTRYEAYFVQRLFDFCHGHHTNSFLRHMSQDPPGSLSDDVSELLTEVGRFQVRSRNPTSATMDELNTVDIVRGFCSCAVGCIVASKLCRHASAVLLHVDLRAGSAYNVASVDSKRQLFEVAHASVLQTKLLSDLNDDRPSQLTTATLPSPSSSTVTRASFVIPPSQSPADVKPNIPLQLTAEERGRFQQIFDRLIAGVASNPTVFVPAVRKMLENIDRYCATETDFVNAISTFAEPHHSFSAKKKLRLSTFLSS